MADNETTADIIAAMRDEAARADMEQGYSLDDAAEMMREFASRIDEAHKRERENYDAKIADLQLRVKLWTDRSDELVKKCVEQYAKLKQVGNAAKLREALESAIGTMKKLYAPSKITAGHIVTCRQKCEAALTASPRNCDKVKTSWDVLKKWHEGLDTANDIVRMLDWLLAPATEQEGGMK